MVISSLVVTVEPDACVRVIEAIATRGDLTLGEPQGIRIPVVGEHADAGAGARAIDEVTALDGVLRVDVVAIDFDAADAANDLPEQV